MNQPRDFEIAALFVYCEGALDQEGGGVQICSREYYETLDAAGFSLIPIEVQSDQRFMTRVRRRLWPRPYKSEIILERAINDIQAALANSDAQYIFLNQSTLRPLGKLLRESMNESCQIILLSHGLRSVDYLQELRPNTARCISGITRAELLMLARMLIAESEQSQYCDYVFCLAPFEVEIERWLGARNVTYIPRTIRTSPLAWKPVDGRLGFVGRLDHPPNREGLMLFLEAVEKIIFSPVHLRLVGSPRADGEAIAKRFPFVQYLGRLTDEQLQREACTWNCFVHPIFCYAMGASTKLAVAVGWEIPVVTTTMGCRGYTWHEGHMPVADTPESLAKLALQLANPEKAHEAQREISKIRRTSPTVAEVASLIRSVLSLPGTRFAKHSDS